MIIIFPIHVKALRAEYKRSPYFRDIVKYIRTGYCSYVGKAQRLFKMLCEDYILMDDILFKIRYVKEQEGKTNLGVVCTRKVHTHNLVPIPCTIADRASRYYNNVPYGEKEVLLSYNVAFNQAICSKLF